MISVVYMFGPRRVSLERKRFSWLSLVTQRQAPVNYCLFQPENGLNTSLNHLHAQTYGLFVLCLVCSNVYG